MKISGSGPFAGCAPHPLQVPALIIDLDGTPTYPKPGILGRLFKEFGARDREVRSPQEPFVGPPEEERGVELPPGGSDGNRAALAHDHRTGCNRDDWQSTSVSVGNTVVAHPNVPIGISTLFRTSKKQRDASRIAASVQFCTRSLSLGWTTLIAPLMEYPSQQMSSYAFGTIPFRKGVHPEECEMTPDNWGGV